jgi:RNA polymerase sigma factor (sigma-70 family)
VVESTRPLFTVAVFRNKGRNFRRSFTALDTSPQTKKEWLLTQEAFDRLLLWLNPDREQAGKRYEQIRLRLIKIFACRGCGEPEDLADETINRVIRRLPEIKERYEGDPALYFYGVAQKVHLEYMKRKPVPRDLPPQSARSEEDEQEYECLERCMEKLTPQNRELVIQYYQDEKRVKVDNRRELAERLGIALNAVRIRAHRIRATLHECVRECLEEASG